MENGFIESFNGRLRDECLNVEWFSSLEEAKEKLANWRDHYNHHRPHSALDDRAPAVFASSHGITPKRFALAHPNRTNGEALVRIARTQDSLLSLWSDFQARNPGSGGP